MSSDVCRGGQEPMRQSASSCRPAAAPPCNRPLPSLLPGRLAAAPHTHTPCRRPTHRRAERQEEEWDRKSVLRTIDAEDAAGMAAAAAAAVEAARSVVRRRRVPQRACVCKRAAAALCT